MENLQKLYNTTKHLNNANTNNGKKLEPDGAGTSKNLYENLPGCSKASGSTSELNGEKNLKRKLPDSVLEVKEMIKKAGKSQGGTKWKLIPVQKDDKNGESTKKNSMNSVDTPKLPPRSSMKLMTGNLAQIMEIEKGRDPFADNYLYETYANLQKIKDGTYSCEKILLLRNERGPLLNALFYEIDRPLPDNIQEGQLVRCIGRFNHKMRFVIDKISPINAAFVELATRLHAICYFTINKDKKM
uniref:Uncharacterized protein n=2 Tax=Lutzomyia longipalpis TaxID=7200 RepID=A0A1B0ETQ1_LUTLO